MSERFFSRREILIGGGLAAAGLAVGGVSAYELARTITGETAREAREREEAAHTLSDRRSIPSKTGYTICYPTHEPNTTFGPAIRTDRTFTARENAPLVIPGPRPGGTRDTEIYVTRYTTAAGSEVACLNVNPQGGGETQWYLATLPENPHIDPSAIAFQRGTEAPQYIQMHAEIDHETGQRVYHGTLVERYRGYFR